MEAPAWCSMVWLAPPPSPRRALTVGYDTTRRVGTSNWPPVGTSTWPPVGTFSWPRTRFSLMHGGYSMFHCGIRSATAHPRPGRYRSGECGRATDRRKPGSIVGSGCPSTTGSAAASRWAHRFSVSARRRPSGPRNVGNIRSPRQFVRSASRTSALRRAGAVVAIAEVNPTCPRLKND